jgi:hypothetical protein
MVRDAARRGQNAPFPIMACGEEVEAGEPPEGEIVSGLPRIDVEADATSQEIQMLIDHGWEISHDQRDARLYSEEWSPIQVAIHSTREHILDNAVESNRAELERMYRRWGIIASDEKCEL